MSRGAGYDATHPVVIATLLHALTLAQPGAGARQGLAERQGLGLGLGLEIDSHQSHLLHDHEMVMDKNEKMIETGMEKNEMVMEMEIEQVKEKESDHMARAGVLFEYLKGLGEYAEDPRSASARRLLPMCYHHMCAGYR